MARDFLRESLGLEPAVQKSKNGLVPGKRTRTDGLRGFVQAKGDLDGGPATIARAARGVEGSGGSLPFLDTIQASFGKHDVGDVRAHTGTEAAFASADIGARAYAMGDAVAFGESPDLHTAAHEAAHVVQQRAGVRLKDGVGSAGDDYERHADAVADLVVAGKSAEPLLDEHTRLGSPGGTAVQLRKHKRARPAVAAPGPAQAPSTQEPQPQAPEIQPTPPTNVFLGETVTILPDGTQGAVNECWIHETEIVRYTALYNAIEANSGTIKIFELSGTLNGQTDREFPGFRDKILAAIRKLMAGPKGRQIIEALMSNSHPVEIRPYVGDSPAKSTDKGMTPDATGVGSTVYVQPGLTDQSVTVFDASGKPLASPVFIALGHELIHSRHYQLGSFNVTPDEDYQDKDERDTIVGERVNPQYQARVMARAKVLMAAGRSPADAIKIATAEIPRIERDPSLEVTENDLRAEHNLAARKGHGGEIH